MSVIYCPKCGYKNEFTLTPPKFCGGCAEPFGGAKKEDRVVSRKRSSAAVVEQDDFDPDETDIDYVPVLSNGLEYDLTLDEGSTFRGSDFIGDTTEPELKQKKPVKRAKSKNKIRGQNKRG